MPRSSLRALLAAQPGIAVVGEAADGVEAVDQALRLRPDLVSMDVRMPCRNGIKATRHLLAGSAPPPKVVVITTFENDDYVTAALSAGASGFVLKRHPVRQIAQAVRVVAAGEAILFPAALTLTRSLRHAAFENPSASVRTALGSFPDGPPFRTPGHPAHPPPSRPLRNRRARRCRGAAVRRRADVGGFQAVGGPAGSPVGAGRGHGRRHRRTDAGHGPGDGR
ncbi:response regulator transcription factor [Streptomyces sp. TLI_146]|uniref:response regulator n=1 Tax=Streptomyces sp. TLI_146 TaxID=1938858 RepID=UPI00214C8672|nr:response regulator transcription factor [Streptomyces sp. TLI_146]